MNDKGNFGGSMRLTAVVMAAVWLVGGMLGIAAGLIYAEWLPGLLGLLAVLFGLVMVRVAQRGRLLPWRETLLFWRYRH